MIIGMKIDLRVPLYNMKLSSLPSLSIYLHWWGISKSEQLHLRERPQMNELPFPNAEMSSKAKSLLKLGRNKRGSGAVI